MQAVSGHDRHLQRNRLRQALNQPLTAFRPGQAVFQRGHLLIEAATPNSTERPTVKELLIIIVPKFYLGTHCYHRSQVSLGNALLGKFCFPPEIQHHSPPFIGTSGS